MLWFALFFSCDWTSETIVEEPSNQAVAPQADQEERPPALNKDGLPNLVPLDEDFRGLEKGCDLAENAQKWLNSLAVYQESIPGWNPVKKHKGKWVHYFSAPKATIYQDYTKLEMSAKKMSYKRFEVQKIEYVLGHQNGISALSIWLAAPLEKVAKEIQIESVEDPMIGTLEMKLTKEEEGTKLVCDWST